MSSEPPRNHFYDMEIDIKTLPFEHRQVSGLGAELFQIVFGWPPLDDASITTITRWKYKQGKFHERGKSRRK